MKDYSVVATWQQHHWPGCIVSLHLQRRFGLTVSARQAALTFSHSLYISVHDGGDDEDKSFLQFDTSVHIRVITTS